MLEIEVSLTDPDTQKPQSSYLVDLREHDTGVQS